MIQLSIMQTPIDYGKKFLETLYNRRDARLTIEFLAADIVIVTPDEIRHFLTKQETLSFIEGTIRQDPRLFNVDIAAIRSAPAAGDTSTVVYEVNLIPKREEDTVNIRCTLCIQKQGAGYTLTFVGISRKYARTDTEQIREFIDNMPGGVIVLASTGGAGAGIRHLYSNSYFYRRLGYEEDDFYSRMEENPFFMLSEEEQRRVRTLLGQLIGIRKAKPMDLQVSLVKSSGRTVASHLVAAAPYKEGKKTVLYLFFMEITNIVGEADRRLKKEVEKAKEAQKAQDVKTFAEENSDAAKVQEKADDAVRDATEKASRAINEAVTRSEEAVRTEAAARKKAEESLARLQEEYDKAEKLHARSDSQYQRRILAMERAMDKEVLQQTEEQKKRLQAQWEQERKETREQNEAERKALMEDRDKKLQEKSGELEKEKERADALSRENFTLKAQLKELQLSERAQDNDTALRLKEKDKCLTRMQYLLSGQLRSVQSMAEAMQKAEDRKRKDSLQADIRAIAENVPVMSSDLVAIAGSVPGGRGGECEFSLSACVDTVRKIIWPQCRQKDLVFDCQPQDLVPDMVKGNKPGLQMAFLAALENAVANTGAGGRITFSYTADPAVHGRAYYHFTVRDTGSGIADEKLPGLFDDPQSELSAARKTLSLMGGSIQVRSQLNQGTQFDITVNLEVLGKN